MFNSFKEIANELNNLGFQSTPPGCIDGYEFEDWLRKDEDFLTETIMPNSYCNFSTVFVQGILEKKDYSYHMNDYFRKVDDLCNYNYKNYKIEYEHNLGGSYTDFLNNVKSKFSEDLLMNFTFYRLLNGQVTEYVSRDDKTHDDIMEAA